MNIETKLKFITGLFVLIFAALLPTTNCMQPDEAALQGQFQAALNQADWADKVDNFTTALAQGEESINHTPSQAIQNSAVSTLNTLYQQRSGQEDLEPLQFLLQKAPQSAFIPRQYASTIKNYLNTVNNEIANPSTSAQVQQQIQPIQQVQVQQPQVIYAPQDIQQPTRSIAPLQEASSPQIDLEIQQAMAMPTIIQKIDGVSNVLNKYTNVMPGAQTQNNFATALQTLFDQRYAAIAPTTKQPVTNVKNKTKKQKKAKHLQKTKKKKIKGNNNIKKPGKKNKKQKTI